MKKKWLVCLLSVACLTASVFAFASCGGGGEDSSQEKSEIEKVYAQYVLHAEAEGEAPLSYKDWLATIKGEKGDKGNDGRGIEKVEYDENGNLIIFYTDDTNETISMPKQEGTAGLHYQKLAGKEEYAVVGIGLAESFDVVIPSSYKGLPVTSIGDYAFFECFGLTSIIIPDSVTSIGVEAFYNCSNLTIYCEAESKPDGWSSEWNYDNRPVVWGYKGETN